MASTEVQPKVPPRRYGGETTDGAQTPSKAGLEEGERAGVFLIPGALSSCSWGTLTGAVKCVGYAKKLMKEFRHARCGCFRILGIGADCVSLCSV